MATTQPKKSIIGKKPLIAILVGILIGGVGIWALKPSGGASAPFGLPTEVAQVPSSPTKVVSTPSGWDTEWSQKLNIKLLAQFDSSGPPAWDAKAHPLVYISTNGPGYGGFLSGIKSPGLVIVDANTYEVVLTKQYALEGVKSYGEDHGLGVSPDGTWIYLPTSDTDKPPIEQGRLLVINAKTLKLQQVLQTHSLPHHIKAFKLYDGRDVVLSYTFNWQPARGSGTWLMDPNDNNKIIGGIRGEELQANPYLAFPHPNGRHLFIGLPPGPIRDPDIMHKLEGSVAVVDMKTWEPIKYYKAGFDPIWTAFTANGKYAFISDGGSDEIIKIDNEAQKIVATSRSAVHGNYGILLDWKEEQLFVVEKGEASHNRGKLLGLVDPIGMRPIDSYVTGGVRADHAILHPDPEKNELWISYNSNFRDVVFDMGKKEVKTTVKHSGSSHNGAFVKYTVLPNGEWKGELLSDQAGLHGSALEQKLKMLGVTETVYGKEKSPVETGRTLAAAPPQEQKPTSQQPTAPANEQPSANGEVKSITVRVTKDGFDGKPNWRATVKKGDTVKITYLYADENGDEHQLFVSGYNVYTPRFSPQDKQVSVEFKASETGTFALFCLNPNCKAHTNLNGMISVTP